MRLGDMTDCDVFWHNFRHTRHQLAGKPKEERQRAYAFLRMGPLNAAMAVALSEAMKAGA